MSIPLTDNLIDNLVDPSNWMSLLARLKPDVRLKDLSIPGTHDSCSRLEACKPISTTQYATLEQQLDAGVRFLDVRIKTDGPTGLKVVHGIEDVGDYYAAGGRLSFQTVLTHIYAWMNKPEHRDECVIMKVVDCDHTHLDTEPADYDTHTRIHDIWKSVDDASHGMKSLDFNTQHTAEDFLRMTLAQAKGKLLLWRVFKDPEVPHGKRKAFGLDLYQLKDEARFDNNPYFGITSPAADGTKRINTLHAQSLYTWKYSGPHQKLTYADKMNVVRHLLYEAWHDHTGKAGTRSFDSYRVNELNIAAIYQSSSDRQDVDSLRYYPITNATHINPLVGALLDQLLSPEPTLPNLSSSNPQGHGSVGIMLFDWAEDPAATRRDFEQTRLFTEPLYKKVILFNFKPSKMFARDNLGVDSIRYQPLGDSPYAALRYHDKGAWHTVEGTPGPSPLPFKIGPITA
ncbi:hypothetical protein [Corallococcus sicarius]|uniref:Phosphatidylinositol diacylglycerol-lyase n=1 Tax=Corallococcus sicarius TaxID=2316726 RepID=A0A3A8NP26_9BACT|nr:hypothetical protein [Corallococcus sicarius]RKH46137.1 hypothetical protein D7X12_06205 [Corallococcus sicarius]